MSGRFALIIANTEYTDSGLAQLTAPGIDAKELVRVLDSREICAFDDVVVLINENASRVNETIDVFLSNRKSSDLLVLYFSGHGVRDEYGSLYLAVKNTNRSRLRSTAIKSDFIREAMDQSRSKRQILILDCCNSGAFAQGTKAEIGGSIGTATAFEGTGYGRVVLTASDATQFAWEGDKVTGEMESSLFTHYLVRGLEGKADANGDGRITIDELYDYVYEQIISITPKQTPGKWSYKQQGEIVLRQNIPVESTQPVPLSEDLMAAINSPFPYVREGAISELELLLRGKNLSLARSARLVLERIASEDDSRRVAEAAAKVLASRQDSEGNQPGVPTPTARLRREKLEQEARFKAEQEKILEEKAELEKRLQEEMSTREKMEALQQRAQQESLPDMRESAVQTREFPRKAIAVENKPARTSWLAPTTLGIAVVLLLLCGVFGFAALNYLGVIGGPLTANEPTQMQTSSAEVRTPTQASSIEETSEPNLPVDPENTPTSRATQAAQPRSSSTPRPTRTSPPPPTRTWTPRPASGTCKDGYVYRLITSSDKVCVPPASKAQAEADNGAAGSRTLLGVLLDQFGEFACASGYVWRGAYDGDLVCVEPAVRQQVITDNNAAQSRWVDGAFGPNTCISGYVWRTATESDLVCVEPAVRDQAISDNSQAESRRAINVYNGNECIDGYVWREAFPGDLVCVAQDVYQQVQRDNRDAPSRTWQ